MLRGKETVYFFLFALPLIHAQKKEETCVKDGVEGACVTFEICKSQNQNESNRTLTQIDPNSLPVTGTFKVKCSVREKNSIVCCLDDDVAIITTASSLTTPNIPKSSTTEYSPPVYDYEVDATLIANRDCRDIPDRYTAPKTGLKAWDKCLEYQEKFVFPCVETLSESKARVKRCHHELDSLMSGGLTVYPREFPHMALLGFGTNADSIQWLCSGSIISEGFILTAANCTYKKDVGPVTYALVGVVSKTEVSEDTQLIKIKNIIHHPEYKPPQMYHDIAILETESPITLSDKVVPACLHVDTTARDDRATVTGWGVDNGGTSTDILQKMLLSKFENSECADIYPPSNRMGNGFNSTSQLCYGFKNRNGLCQSETGGPIQLQNHIISCMYSIVGVTSYGAACGAGDKPGIYTKVLPYVSWIESIVWPGIQSTPTEYEPPAYDYVVDDPGLIDERNCRDVPGRITSPKTGQKAWDKCIDYQEEYVYPCMDTLLHSRTRVNRCNHYTDDLIMGGTNAAAREYPHMALLGYGTNLNCTKWLCGGIIVSHSFILTSASCTYKKNQGQVTHALVGVVSKTKKSEESQQLKIKNIIYHPEYRPPQLYHDIALLETESQIKLSDTVVPACLHVDTAAYDRGATVGWGADSNGTEADNLQKILLDKFEDSECADLFPPSCKLKYGFNSTTQMCYGYRNSSNTCQGEVGGPLQVMNPNISCMYTVLGVTSYPAGCDKNGRPGIYTKVSAYITWIESIVWTSL